MKPGTAVAAFVTPHGFGHAARACAVMEAIRRRTPAVRFEVFTTVPEAFFRQSLKDGFGYHFTETDVGLVQKSPFEADIDATVRALDAFLPIDGERCAPLAETVQRLGCTAVLCDISPLGIAVARTAGVVSVLVENFTWDWIYRDYETRWPQIAPHSAVLGTLFAGADIHVQTEPVCRPAASADLAADPISRAVRTDPQAVRRRIGAPADRPMVVISLGGVAQRAAYLDRLVRRTDLFFVIVNADREGRLGKNLIALRPFSDVYHPDLVNAADALVGKTGYSTVAEVCQTGVPYGYLARQDFKESAVLDRFIRRRLSAVALDSDTFSTGGWVDKIDALLQTPRRPVAAGGAGQTAALLVRRLRLPKE